MRTVFTAAVGLPTIVLTAALVVVVCFWLLVAMGAARAGAFDTDVDLRTWRMDGVPVSVALSLLTLFAWCASVGAGVLLALALPPGPGTGTPAASWRSIWPPPGPNTLPSTTPGSL
jgi:hypothetical protein